MEPNSVPTERGGFLYVASNETITAPDGVPLLKIGFTRLNPYHRSSELSAPAGVAGPFKIECYYHLKSNPNSFEREVHQQLKAHRHNKRKEFFNCPAQTIIDTCERILSEKPDRFICDGFYRAR